MLRIKMINHLLTGIGRDKENNNTATKITLLTIFRTKEKNVK